MIGVPMGYPALTPHLSIRGCAAAIEFYKQAFSAEEHGRMPGPDGQSIMHAELRIGGSTLFVNDENPDMGALSPQALGGTPITLHLYVPHADPAFERAVRAGCKPVMPLADTFWGDRYGIVSDPYGFQWAIASRIENLTPEQIMQRAAQQFGG